MMKRTVFNKNAKLAILETILQDDASIPKSGFKVHVSESTKTAVVCFRSGMTESCSERHQRAMKALVKGERVFAACHDTFRLVVPMDQF